MTAASSVQTSLQDSSLLHVSCKHLSTEIPEFVQFFSFNSTWETVCLWTSASTLLSHYCLLISVVNQPDNEAFPVWHQATVPIPKSHEWSPWGWVFQDTGRPRNDYGVWWFCFGKFGRAQVGCTYDFWDRTNSKKGVPGLSDSRAL